MYKVFPVFEDRRNIKEIEAYWRETGYPLRSKSEYDLKKEFLKVLNLSNSKICEDGIHLKQAMNGCGLLWTYFPHWVEVECGNSKSLIDSWNDDVLFEKLIEKTYRYELLHNNRGKFSVNRLRQNAKVYCAKQTVSNFRPTVAKYIYDTYGNKGVVWDMSCGWGGRLFGFYASDCSHYIGTDPATKTMAGLEELKNDFSFLNKKVSLFLSGSEEFTPEKESVDLCFTSPPYFNTEIYSKEETQSCIKFQEKEEWEVKFLKKTFENCYYGLKDGGYMIINIANVRTFKDLEERTIKRAIEAGFELEKTLYLILSSISGKGKKTEPVFVFKKHRKLLN